MLFLFEGGGGGGGGGRGGGGGGGEHLSQESTLVFFHSEGNLSFSKHNQKIVPSGSQIDLYI